MSERRQVWVDHWLSRVGIAMIGPGFGLLVVVALRDAGLGTSFGQAFGAVGLFNLIVGLSLLALGWAKTK